MKKNIFILTLSIGLFPHFIFSQAVQLVQNGGFESGSPQPTRTEQLNALYNYGTVNNVDYWQSSPISTTCDWIASATQNYSDVYQGGCPIEQDAPGNDPLFIIDAQPKLTTHDGSSFYAGVGRSESMSNRLSSKTCKNGKVKISFWFALRSDDFPPANGYITVALMKEAHNTGAGTFELVSLGIYKPTQTNSAALFPPCQWHYYESDWIQVDNNEYEGLFIGRGQSPAGDFFHIGYVYIDDVNLYSGCACCPDHMQYENTSSLPPLTVMDNYIRAGNDAGVPNTSGNVTVLSGQNVTFKAGQIILEPGFSTDPGANFQAISEDCSPNTHTSGEPISLAFLPNVFTPNGDGVNDLYCIHTTGADEYRFQVFDRWGLNIFDQLGNIESNFACIWDGTCNNNCSGPVCNDTYFVILELFNCQLGKNKDDHDTQFAIDSNVTVLGANCRVMESTTQQQSQIPKENILNPKISIIPNPSTGIFTLQLKESAGDGSASLSTGVFIYNSLGQEIYKSSVIGHQSSVIDLSSQPKGIYFIKVISGEKIYTEKAIVQ